MRTWWWLLAVGCAPPVPEPVDDPPAHETPETVDTAVTDPVVDADADGAPLPDDCDDADPARYPGATEVCDGVDQDCDGAVDEEASDAVQSWPDADGDGFGDPTTAPEARCDLTGRATLATDCDDANGDASPAAFESCATAWDDDCDGAVNEDDAAGCAVTWADGDGDGFGAAELPCSCAPAGVPTSGDCDDADATVSPGAAESCLTAADDDCDGATDAVDAIGCVAWYADGDLDGAGAGAATCSCLPAGPLEAGDCDDADPARSPLLPDACEDGLDQDCDGVDDRCAWSGSLHVADVADTVYGGTTVLGLAGERLALGGDYTGDGVPDAVITEQATVQILAGPIQGELTSADAYASVAGDYWQTDEFGTSLAFLDANGDGVDDVAIGDSGAWSTGEVYVMYGATAGARFATAPDVVLSGRDYLAYFGLSTAVLDANGDGSDDLLVGARDLGRYGGAGLFLGPLVDADMDAASSEITGTPVNSDLGLAVASLGDTDGDGLDDVLLGDRYATTPDFDSGAAYVLLGPTATMDVGGADASITGSPIYTVLGQFVASGDLDGDGYGDAVLGGAGLVLVFAGPVLGALDATAATATLTGDDGIGGRFAVGDTTGDGADDLVLPAPYTNGRHIEEGAVYVVHGGVSGSATVPSLASVVFRGAAERDYFGGGVAVGDADGDAYQDMWLAAAWSDVNANSAGRAWLLHGP